MPAIKVTSGQGDKWRSGAAQDEALDGVSQTVGPAADTYRDTEEQLVSQLRG